MRPPLPVLVGVLALSAPLLALAGCSTPTPAPVETETYVSGTDAPTDPVAAITPAPMEPDVVSVVTATATAANGATLSLELRTHYPTRFDDVGTETLPAAMAESCTEFTLEKFSSEAWSFTRLTMTAIPADAAVAWPTDAPIRLAPPAAGRTVARGDLLDDPSATGSACAKNKVLTGQAKGGVAIGNPGDADALSAWASAAYGFVAPAGVTLSNCTATVTDLGKKVAGVSAWTLTNDAVTCAIGAPGAAR